jgi:hypothetical protein
MKMILSAVAVALALTSASALASHCPADMKKIDAALAKNPQLSSADMSKVTELRAKGEQQHNSGDHSGAVSTLGEAMKILGVK